MFKFNASFQFMHLFLCNVLCRHFGLGALL